MDYLLGIYIGLSILCVLAQAAQPSLRRVSRWWLRFGAALIVGFAWPLVLASKLMKDQ